MSDDHRPNVIIFGMDTTPANHLGCYGYPRPTSPNIDRLARNGLQFADANLTGLPTTPGWTSMLTGVHPLNSGIVIHAEPPQQHALAPDIVFLHETLAQNGYRTAALEGRGRTFRSPYWMRNWQSYLDRGGESTHRRGIPAAHMADILVDWIESCEADDGPFYLFSHWWDPHWPYYPPAPYDRMFYAGDERNPGNTSLTKFHEHPWWTSRISGGGGMRDPREQAHIDLVRDVTDLQFLIALFDGEIAYMDAMIGRVLAALEARGLADDTLTIVVADHGESIVDHDMFFNHGDLYQTNVHIPLILHHPAGLPEPVQVPDSVEHIDLVPTILDYLDIESPPCVDGMSLMPAVRGQALEHPPICMTNNNFGMNRAWRSGRWKLIEHMSPGHLGATPGTLELYDVMRDPDERTNLIATHRALAEALRDEMHAFVARVLDGRPDPQLTYANHPSATNVPY